MLGLRLEDFDAGTFREILMRYWRIFRGNTQKLYFSRDRDWNETLNKIKEQLKRGEAVFLKLDAATIFEPKIGLSIRCEINGNLGQATVWFSINSKDLRRDYMDTDLVVDRFTTSLDAYLFSRRIGVYPDFEHVKHLGDDIETAIISDGWAGSFRHKVEELRQRAVDCHDECKLACETYEIIMLRTEELLKYVDTLSNCIDGVDDLLDGVKDPLIYDLAIIDAIVRPKWFVY